jgi:hypothetical protein
VVRHAEAESLRTNKKLKQGISYGVLVITNTHAKSIPSTVQRIYQARERQSNPQRDGIREQARWQTSDQVNRVRRGMGLGSEVNTYSLKRTLARFASRACSRP